MVRLKVRTDSDLAYCQWLIVLLAIGFVVRIGVWHIYWPFTTQDTGTYVQFTHELFGTDSSTYDGRRTPGYPFVLNILGIDYNKVWFAQMIAGLLISAAFFVLGYHFTENEKFAFFAGMTYNFNIGQVLFERIILPESLTTLCVVSAALAVILIDSTTRNWKRQSVLSIVSGGCAALAVMLRPQFVFLPILLALICFFKNVFSEQSTRKRSLVHACLVAGPGVAVILLWSCFNYFELGRFTLTTQTGIGLTEHTIAFAELAPDQFGTMRDILIESRDIHIAQTGRHTATWDAIPELRRVTGWSLPKIDGELGKMAVRLIVAHPMKYLALVGDAWISFWLVANPQELEKPKLPETAELIHRVWVIEHLLLRILNGLFLVLTCLVLVSNRWRQRIGSNAGGATLALIILTSSVVQALLVGVDNTRYSVTVQPLIVLVATTAIFNTYRARARFAML